MQMNTFKMASLYNVTLYHSTNVQSKYNLVQQQTGNSKLNLKTLGTQHQNFGINNGFTTDHEPKKKKEQIANEVKQ